MAIPPNWARAALGLVLIAFWTGIITWLRAGRSPAIIAGVLLAAFLMYPVYALIKPVGQHDPTMAAAQAGLVAIVLFLIILILVLAAGVGFHQQRLVWTAFLTSIIPVVAVSCGAIAYFIGLCLKRS